MVPTYFSLLRWSARAWHQFAALYDIINAVVEHFKACFLFTVVLVTGRHKLSFVVPELLL